MKLTITKEAKIGFFVAACLFAMFWGINFLKGKNIFSPNNVYYAVFTSIDGLENTNDVLINGFKVGLVKNIEFKDIRSGKFLVTLLIGKKYEIPRKTVAKLISNDIMGGKAIKLEVSPDTEYYQPGDTLPSAIEVGLIDQLGHQMVPVKQKAEKLMVDLDSSLKVFTEVFNESNREQLNQGIVNLNKSLYNLSQSTAALDTMLNTPKGSLRNIFTNVESISNNLKKNNKELTNIIQNFSSVSDSLAKVNIVQTMTKLDASLKDLNAILLKVNSGEGTLGSLVNNDTLYNNLESASKGLDLLLKDIKNNPKRYVNFSIIDLSRTKYIEEKSK
ncbi:mammalian cell entry protein [Tenuifilaceae bacterium CYCD]|nr:mammalian cell entry protein [Tenuifilaceae bacterium CYCD]